MPAVYDISLTLLAFLNSMLIVVLGSLYTPTMRKNALDVRRPARPPAYPSVPGTLLGVPIAFVTVASLLALLVYGSALVRAV